MFKQNRVEKENDNVFMYDSTQLTCVQRYVWVDCMDLNLSHTKCFVALCKIKNIIFRTLILF